MKTLRAALLTSSLALGASAPAQTAVTTPAPLASEVQPIGDSLFPKLGQAGLDVLDYDVSLNVDQPGTPNLRGEVTLTFTSSQPLTWLSLDYLGSLVIGTRWNDRPVAFQYDKAAGKLLIKAPEPLPAGVQASVTVRFAGRPGHLPDPSLPFSLGWQAIPGVLTQPGASYAFSEPDGTRTFLPVNDHPSDPATFTTRITVPRGYTAAASGVQQSVTDVVGGKQFVFRQAEPIPTYTLGIQVNQFVRVDSPSVPVGAGGAAVQRRDYFPVGTDEAIKEPYRLTSPMLSALAEWFGPYPFQAAGAAIITSRVPALETATLITMPVAASFERVVVHELAHQWFGDRVVLGDWSDTWLNEGFATYAELLWAESQGQNTRDLVNVWYARLRDRPTRPLIAHTEEQMFDQTAYLRGALALHALRRQVGDPAFKAFLHAYVQEFGHRPVRTADLMALAQAHLGSPATETLRLWVDLPTLPKPPEP